MEQNLPPELPWPGPGLPASPVVVPMLPTRRKQPGRHAPLPDPVAVRQLAVPDSAPPYDDEQHHDEQQHDELAGQARPAGRGQDPAAGAGGHRRGSAAADPGQPAPTTPARQTGDQAPGSDGWPGQFAQVLAEALAGSRPANQLVPWTTEQARRRIRQLGPTLATGQRPRVRRIMTSAPSEDVLEMTAVVGFGARVRVLALRLERADAAEQAWQCTAVESA
jgi:hypothetical protein